ncbi:hypothetical protein [Nocardia niwae]|uniref:hypothetical protein n=1 Tax=Nocardia niwae TaxID=626084 RepID=UPI0033EA8901
MTDSHDAFDLELARVLTACRDGDHALTDSESRTVAAAYAQQQTSLQHWGAGIDVAHPLRLVEDTQWLLDAAAVVRDDTDPHRYPDEARNALCALRDYFRSRARVRPTLADYKRELTQIYASEIEFLRARGHSPRIEVTGHGAGFPGLIIELDHQHELYATNGESGLVGSEIDESPGPWSIGIYDQHTGHTLTNATDPHFATAYATAVGPFSRPRTDTTAAHRVDRAPALDKEISPRKTTLRLPNTFADRLHQIVGMDKEGCVVIDDGSTSLVTLTPCCHAYGKGSADSPTGVVCRACYDIVDIKHAGGGSDIAIGRDDLNIIIES